jgi:dipeptidyl aminopeptidase/acylaminoacyl peptidase
MKIRPALGLALLAVFAGAAGAQQTPPSTSGEVREMDPRLKRMDTDGDGQVSAAEKDAARRNYLRRVDTSRKEPKPGSDMIGGRRISELVFTGTGGVTLRAVLSMPADLKPKSRIPLAVTIHGGMGDRDFGYLRTLAAPREQGAITFSPTVGLFNEQPWAVLSIDYRRSGGKLYEDVIAGIRHAKTLPGIDPKRICAMGGSHGGKLLMEALPRLEAGELRCAIAGSPFMPNAYVSLMQDIDTPPLDGLTPSARQQLLEMRQRMGGGRTRSREQLEADSFEMTADRIKVPTLLLTSKGDDQVPYPLLLATIDKMQKAKAPLTVQVAELVPHGFYWGRENSMARAGRGERSPAEDREEEAARAAIMQFLKQHFR